MIDPIQRKTDPNQFWNIADRWFRILEIGLILGVLSYFKIKTNNFLITGVYWISWAVFYWWFVEIGESIAANISLKKSLTKKWLIWVTSMYAILLFHFLITSTTQWIIQQQFK